MHSSKNIIDLRPNDFTPPGPNRTHVQWNREWLAEMLVAEAAKEATQALVRPATYTPPATRLVGIETNPGPPKARKNQPKKKKNNTPRRPPQEIDPQRIITVARKVLRLPPKQMHDIGSYMESLKDPFLAPVGKLGFGTFTPTSLHSGWANFPIVQGPNGSFALSVNFAAAGTGSATVFQPASPAGTLSGGTVTNYSLANSTTLNLLAQSARIVCGAVRVVVNYPTTVAAGRVGGVYFPDEGYANVAGTSVYTLMNLGGYRDFVPTCAGSVGGQVAYRPVDFTSFEFQNSILAGHNTSIFTPQAVVVGNGWPVGTTANASVFVIYETLGGLDASGDEDYTPPGITPEAIASSMGSIPPPVTPSITSVDMLDRALSNVRRSGMRTGFSLPSRGISRADAIKKLADYSRDVLARNFPEGGESQQSSSSSSSSSSSHNIPAQRTITRAESDGEPEHGLAESVYLPSSLLSSMGLKRA